MTTQRRAAVPGDEEALAELNAFVHKLHVRHAPSFFKPADLKEVADYFRDLIKKPTVQIWIAEQGGTPVGYACVLLRQRPEDAFCRARKWLAIDQIGVRPGYQRRGIGRQIVRHVVRAARKAHIRHVELTSWCFNTQAHKAFRRLGFSPSTVRFAREFPSTSDQ